MKLSCILCQMHFPDFRSLVKHAQLMHKAVGTIGKR